MPIREIEIHPYLKQGQINGAKKLILGSFPVYECTDPDSLLKEKNRSNEGTIRFFYGSNRNSLWSKYSQYVDSRILPPWNSELILTSLKERGIAISDTIASCERYVYKVDKKTNQRLLYPFSSEDIALKNKTWNTDIIKSLVRGGVSKILCTSKGVLNDLEKHIICQKSFPFGKKERQLSHDFQKNFIEGIGGNNAVITNEIGKVFIVGSTNLYALAIPSPGSPQRQTHEFGCETMDRLGYANAYFEQAFNWFKE
jgi:hypothetical protein